MIEDLKRKFGKSLEIFAPAKEFDIAQAQSILNIEFTPDHLALLRESNGLHGEYSLTLIWPVEQIVETNSRFRSDANFSRLYMPFESLLFFGDAGNGDMFAFPVLTNGTLRQEVFVWSHGDDSRTWLAKSLSHFLNGWLSGKISI